MVWKIASTFQCLIRRTVETMGRSLIETGAVVRNLTDSTKSAVERSDVDALDQAVMHASFSTMDDAGLAERPEYKATRILKMIDIMDKSLFGDNAPKPRDAYRFLSEFAHPNWPGTVGLYSNIDGYRTEFGNIAEKKESVLPHLLITSGMIWLVEIAAADIDELMPRIRAFVPG